MRFQNKRFWISLAAIAAVLVSVVFLLYHSPKKTQVNPGDHIDPFSHETISSPPGKAPDQYGVQANQPLYLGFDKLLNYGLTSNQIQNVKNAFYRYSQTQSQPIKIVSIDVDHIYTQHDPTNPNSPFEINFRVQFDEKNIYNARVEYSGLNDVRLFILDSKTSAVVFDSQILNSQVPTD